MKKEFQMPEVALIVSEPLRTAPGNGKHWGTDDNPGNHYGWGS